MVARQAALNLHHQVVSLCTQGKLSAAITLLLDHPHTSPDYLTFTCLTQACARGRALSDAKLAHGLFLPFLHTYPPHIRTIAHNHLIRMYDQCSAPQLARQVFDTMCARNRVSWNLMVAAHARAAHGSQAFDLLIQMHVENVRPDKFTFISIFSACTKSECFDEGRNAHVYLIFDGLDHVGDIGNALITFYGTCACLEDALRTLDMMPKRNVVSWNAILAVYCEYRHGEFAFHLYARMRSEGIEPNNVSFITLLTACSILANLDKGKKIHALIQTSGSKLDVALGTALVDMYNKCGDFDTALKVFTEMPAGNVLSWTTILSAHVKHGYMKEACSLFCQMRKEGVKASNGIVLTLLETCASAGSLEDGRLLHACIVNEPDDTDDGVANALISMYNRCGSLEDAWAVSKYTCVQDSVSWNAMISANSQHGHGYKAFDLFRQMQLKGVKPTENTFISVLSACSHTGLLSEGLSYYDSMARECGIVPLAQHYTCMVDLFGRAGQLDESEEFVYQMPRQPGILEWMALLSACRTHSYMDKASCAVKQALELDPLVTGAYVALSNILAVNRWNEDAEYD